MDEWKELEPSQYSGIFKINIVELRLDRLYALIFQLNQSFVEKYFVCILDRPVVASQGHIVIFVGGDDIKKALLQGGSPATPDDLRKRFETFLNDRCKGKDASKLRFVVE